MAEELGVNRKTVIVAYDELIAQATTSRGHQGHLRLRKTARSPATRTQARCRQLQGARRGTCSSTSSSRTTRCARHLPGRASFSIDDNIPDTWLFPAESFARAYRSAMSLEGKVGKTRLCRSSQLSDAADSDIADVEYGPRAGDDARARLYDARKPDGDLPRVQNSDQAGRCGGRR